MKGKCKFIKKKEILKNEAYLKFIGKKDIIYGYNGIPIFSAPNLHEKCFGIFKNLNLNKDIRILILGAGAGAFDQRLIDYGYSDITAIEIIKGNYRANNNNIFDY